MESGVVLTLAFGVGVGVQGLVSRDSTFDLNITIHLGLGLLAWSIECGNMETCGPLESRLQSPAQPRFQQWQCSRFSPASYKYTVQIVRK